MRGEEVQIFGAIQLTGVTTGMFVLPGTHNKWATVRDGRVTGFRTCMTGEFYALLSRHSILARTLEADAPLDEPAFLRGVACAANGEGLLHNAFGVRTLGLFGRMSAAASASYLSGVLIGEELRTQPLQGYGRRGADRRAGAHGTLRPCPDDSRHRRPGARHRGDLGRRTRASHGPEIG